MKWVFLAAALFGDGNPLVEKFYYDTYEECVAQHEEFMMIVHNNEITNIKTILCHQIEEEENATE